MSENGKMEASSIKSGVETKPSESNTELEEDQK